MPRPKKKYHCTVCGDLIPRANVLVKRVVFTTPGEGQHTVKSRVIAYLCPSCKDKDAEWALPSRRESEPIRRKSDGRAVEESNWNPATEGCWRIHD